mgnify:CR=1 FL=1
MNKYNKMPTITELKAEAKSKGLKGYSTLNKAGLMALVNKSSSPAKAKSPVKAKASKKVVVGNSPKGADIIAERMGGKIIQKFKNGEYRMKLSNGSNWDFYLSDIIKGLKGSNETGNSKWVEYAEAIGKSPDLNLERTKAYMISKSSELSSKSISFVSGLGKMSVRGKVGDNIYQVDGLGGGNLPVYRIYNNSKKTEKKNEAPMTLYIQS